MPPESIRARIPHPDAPLGLTSGPAAGLIGVSRSHWHKLRKSGGLPQPRRLGAKLLWSRAELIAWFNSGANLQPPAKPVQPAAGKGVAND